MPEWQPELEATDEQRDDDGALGQPLELGDRLAQVDAQPAKSQRPDGDA